jgi:drug/metabolite transporter (DMT)-like permease
MFAGSLFAAEFACIFLGLQFTTASRMAVFIYLSPFVVAVGMPFIARSERLSLPQLIGLSVAFAGVAWAFAEGFTQSAAGARQWLGDALGVAAAVLWGATTLTIRATPLGKASAEKTLFYQLAVSGVSLCAASLAKDVPWAAQLSVLAWASLAFQMFVVSFASYLLWFWLVRHYQATKLASFTLLTPVFGLLLGALLLGEPITVRLLIALGAVAIGIVMVNRAG